MKLSDFHFELPDNLIAQFPLQERSASRLLVQAGPSLIHAHFVDLPQLLQPGDHLVLNDTRVIAARLYGQKSSGGKIELLIERVDGADELLTKIRASKSPKVGSQLIIGDAQATVLGRQDDLFRVRLNLPSGQSIESFIESAGQLPLPPYIQRQPDKIDAERYQTVFARESGAVAAPTAGLHFDAALLKALSDHGITHSFITLHVGAGTFMPVRTDKIDEHVMHPERVSVSEQTVADVQAVKARGGRVIAVGTTCVRSLEAASASGELRTFHDDTRLFITPGTSFNTVDGMITNFHLPESTLLMLVCAFGGYQSTMSAYATAIEQQYRFFSYGDAMLLWPHQEL